VNGPQPEDDGALDAAEAAATALRELMVVMVTAELPEPAMAELAGALGKLTDAVRPYAGPSRYRSDPSTGRRPALEGPALALTNSVTGLLNPLAPPMHIETHGPVSTGTGVFGPQYEGAPGCVHGGFLAAVLESLLPRPATHLGLAKLTATLTIRYRRPTPIATRVDLRAELGEVNGRKIRTFGTISVAGEVHVEAEAVLVTLPGAAVDPTVGTSPAG
jgi:hypothetical protein